MIKWLGEKVGNFAFKKNSMKEAASNKFADIKQSVLHPVQGFRDAKANAIFEAAKKKADEKIKSELGNNSGTNSKSNNTLEKKEEKLADKESKAIDNSQKNNRKFMDRIRDLRKGPSEDARSRWAYHGLTAIVILAILAHVFDAFSSYPRPWGFIVWLFYISMIVFAEFISWFSDRKIFDSEIAGLFIAIGLAYGLPMLTKILPDSISFQWMIDISGAILLLPPVVLYLMFKYPDHTLGNRVLKIYTFLWCVFLVLLLLQSPFFQDSVKQGGKTITDPGGMIVLFGDSVVKTVENTLKSVEKSWNMAIASATGQPYAGEAEGQRGIYIENFKAIEKNYYTSSDIFAQAKIRATNLVGEITVRTKCFVVDGKTGVTYPEVITIINDDENLVDCDLGSLPKGNHHIKMTGSFEFETDARIEYSFVDESTRPELYKDLGINDEYAKAIYTGGPVQVGMPSLHQPLRVSISGKNKKVGNYPFGVSLTNGWTQGKLTRGLNYVLEVPPGIDLTQCNRNQTKEFDTIDGRKRYYFSIDVNNVKETFDSVNCRMQMENPSELFRNDIVARRTFNAKVVYEYVVEQTTYLYVEEDYATS